MFLLSYLPLEWLPGTADLSQACGSDAFGPRHCKFVQQETKDRCHRAKDMCGSSEDNWTFCLTFMFLEIF